MKEDLILIHGALGTAEQMHPFAEKLESFFNIHNLELPGHGKTKAVQEFSISFFADYVISYMDDHNINRTSVFGYSMGGYIGLLLATLYPVRFNSIITFGTKLQWNPEIAAKEITMLDPILIKEKIPAYAKQLSEKHKELCWEQVLQHTSSLMTDLGNKGEDLISFSDIAAEVLLMLGDRDKMVSLAETEAAYKKLQRASLAVLPGQPHPLEKTDTDLLCFMIRKHLNKKS